MSKLEQALTEGWEGLNEISLDIRDSQQAVEDLNKLCLRVLGTEDGKKLMGWLRASPEERQFNMEQAMQQAQQLAQQNPEVAAEVVGKMQ